MKVSKDGKMKLAKNERQIGNFILKNEEHYIKIQDINSQITHRVSKLLNIGRFLEMAYKERSNENIHAYIAMMWNFSSIIPDVDFVRGINEACVACVNRHKEFYGIEEDISTEEDSEILREAEEVYNEIEELKKEAENDKEEE
jgi:DNA-binding cell septation regulator SpoVG